MGMLVAAAGYGGSGPFVDASQDSELGVNAHRNGTLDVRRKGTPLKGLEGLSHDTRNWIPCLTKNGALLS